MLLSKNEKRFLILGFLVSMLVASFVDLPLTQALYTPNSPFGLFFKYFASFPGVFLGAMCFGILTITPPRDARLLWANRIGNGSLTLIFGYALTYTPLISMGFRQPLIGILGTFIVVGLTYQLMTKYPQSKLVKLRKYAIVGALTMFASMFAINVIKIGWGRERFAAFNQDNSLFTPWFIPQGFNLRDSYKSFPSGHSQFAAVTLISTMLPSMFDSLKGKERMFLLISVIWIVLVMLSRLILGDHFLSDTVVGVAITVAIFAGLKKRLL